MTKKAGSNSLLTKKTIVMATKYNRNDAKKEIDQEISQIDFLAIGEHLLQEYINNINEPLVIKDLTQQTEIIIVRRN